MSNHLAIATVTAALRQLLIPAAHEAVDGAKVTTMPLDSSKGQIADPGINILLYQVAPNPELRNDDLPSRRADSTVLRPPQVAVDLDYLISFAGDDRHFESHRLMGSALKALHSRPVLTRALIREALHDVMTPPEPKDYFASSDLADAFEQLRLIPLGLTAQEVSEIWTGFFNQSEFRVSVAYRVSSVLITSETERPSPALPVRRSRFLVGPVASPVVETVQPIAGADEPIVVGSRVVARGARLSGDVTKVRVAGQDLNPTSVTDTEVRFPLDEPYLNVNSLRAGVLGVQVVHESRIPGTLGAESNVAPFILRPKLNHVEFLPQKTIKRPKKQTLPPRVFLDVAPPLGVRQRASLLLNPAPGSSNTTAYSYPVDTPEEDSESLVVTVIGAAEGTYLVRLLVDGAESPLDFGPDGLFIGPTVDVTPPEDPPPPDDTGSRPGSRGGRRDD